MSQATPNVPVPRRVVAAIAIAAGAVTIAIVVTFGAVTGYLRPRTPEPALATTQLVQPAAEVAPAAAEVVPAPAAAEPEIVYTTDPPRRAHHDDDGDDHDRRGREDDDD